MLAHVHRCPVYKARYRKYRLMQTRLLRGGGMLGVGRALALRAPDGPQTGHRRATLVAAACNQRREGITGRSSALGVRGSGPLLCRSLMPAQIKCAVD